VAVAVLAALVALTVVTSAVDGPSGRRAAPAAVEVVGATAVCPDMMQSIFLQTRVSVGAAPLPPGRSATGGRIESTVVRGADVAPVPISEPGQVSIGLGTRTHNNGVVVAATGALASGLEVEQVARGRDGRFRGLASMRCTPPRRDAWFVGAATGLADLSVLVLANVDDTPATVDVTAFGSRGPTDPRPGQGLTVAPHDRLLVPLDTLAPDQHSLVVRVLSRQGRVAAALRNARLSGTVQLGFDYVPLAQPPAEQVVVPGFPAGPGVRSLIIGNPGVDDVAVRVQVTLRDGQFVPQGRDEVAVPAGQSVVLPLDQLAATSPLTAVVTSLSGPVVAGGVVVDTQQFQVGSIRELSYAGSATALSGPALLTDLVIDRPTESTLLLSAPEEAATVVITPIRVLGAAGEPPPARRVSIPAGRVVTFRLSTFFPPGTNARLAVDVRPEGDSGPVYATRYLRERGARGTLTTLLTLQGPAQLVPRPVVVADAQSAYAD
jgi:hypothetical protein